MVVATTSITQIAPYTISFSRAATAADQLFSLVDRASEINSFDERGSRPTKTHGVISLDNVSFSYPTRPDVTVLDDFSLDVPAGKVTALVVSWVRAFPSQGGYNLTPDPREQADQEKAQSLA